MRLDTVRERAVDEVRDEVERITAARAVELEWTILQESAAIDMAPALRERLERAVTETGIVARSLVSGAGHDAVVLSRICPAAMLFVRCAGGVSHDPLESVSEEDVAVALDVLEHVVRSLA